MLRDEHALRMFEKRVLKGICGCKKEDVTGILRKLHDVELLNLYSSFISYY
jgi:redox-regulated HSP33 family molecular chaperone